MTAARLARATLILAAAIPAVRAQNAPPQIIIPPNVPPEIAEQIAKAQAEILRQQAAGGQANANANAAQQKAAGAAKNQDPAAAAMLKLQLVRSPDAVLQANAEPLDEAAQKDPAKRFERAVMVGDWAAVKAILAELPEADAEKVFKHLAQRLAMPVPVPNRGGNQQPPPLLPALGFDDALAIAEAAPGGFDSDAAAAIGRLLAAVIRQGFDTKPLLAKLEAGAGAVGGSDPAKRALAAAVLIEAGQPLLAESFLPPLEEALKGEDAKTLERLSIYYLTKANQPGETDALPKAWAANLRALELLSAKPAKPGEGEPEAQDPSQAQQAEAEGGGDPNAQNQAQANAQAGAVAAGSGRAAAIARALQILPRLNEVERSAWLGQLFGTEPGKAHAFMAAAAEASLKGAGGPNLGERLQLVSLIAELARNAARAEMADAGPMLARAWLREAQITEQWHPGPETDFIPPVPPGYDPYSWRQMHQQQNQQNRGNRLPSIDPAKIEDAAPAGKWLDSLDAALRLRVDESLARLALKKDEAEGAIERIEALAADLPDKARALAQEYLGIWANQNNPNNASGRFARNYMPQYYYGGMYGQQGVGIPLTRSMQVRNLKRLGEVLAKLRALPIEPLEPGVLADTFSAAHSNAEVFRAEDIEGVFGPFPEIESELAANLLGTMRGRLASVWRNAKVQQQARTNRKDEDIEAEVNRGYDLASGLAEAALEKRPDDWRFRMLKAALAFDWAEYQYGNKVDLETYVAKREECFTEFERAAALYAGDLPKIPVPQQRPDVYMMWFNANLGASDLALVTRQAEPSQKNLEKIRDTILALPGDAGSRHLDMFARELSQSASSIAAHLKMRYLRAGLIIAGDNEEAKAARDLVRYYDDLLDEIQFHAEVDGSTDVGHGAPFGLFLALRYTEAIGRESGGFTKYLTNNQGNPYYYNPYGNAPKNYREDFEKHLGEKFLDSFNVVSVTFHDPRVPARSYGVEGWRETPYAYALIQAKDPSIDKIPSLQLDLEFSDSVGQVVLPVTTPVLPIDARQESGEARPAENIEITQILDDREFGSAAKLTLDIQAKSRGLVPELDQLLALPPAGFRIAQTEAQGLSIAEMSVEGGEVFPVSERSWLLTLEPENTAAAPREFAFPAALIAGSEVTRKRYDDADLAAVESESAPLGEIQSSLSPWAWTGIAAAALAAIGAALFFVFGGKKGEAVAAPRYAVPDRATPFNVLSLLYRLSDDTAVAKSAERKGKLRETIAELEKKMFTQGGQAPAESELRQIAEDWVRAAG